MDRPWKAKASRFPGKVGGGFHGGRGLVGAGLGLGTESEPGIEQMVNVLIKIFGICSFGWQATLPNGSRRTKSIGGRKTFSIAFLYSENSFGLLVAENCTDI